MTAVPLHKQQTLDELVTELRDTFKNMRPEHARASAKTQIKLFMEQDQITIQHNPHMRCFHPSFSEPAKLDLTDPVVRKEHEERLSLLENFLARAKENGLWAASERFKKMMRGED